MNVLLHLWRRLCAARPPAEPLAAARARVEALLARHCALEQASSWPGAKLGMAELGTIREIMERTAAQSCDGRVFLRQLERALWQRHRDYVSEAEDGSDRGRLGSVLHDLQALIAAPDNPAPQ